MTSPRPRVSDRGAAQQTVLWLIALLLAVIATALWLRPAGDVVRVAQAQNRPIAGARGVFAFTGAIDRDREGLFMLDVDSGTIWCYAFETIDGTRKLRLIAARSWIYDRYLQDFNCAAPDFREIQQLVQLQRQQTATPPPADTTDSAGPGERPRTTEE